MSLKFAFVEIISLLFFGLNFSLRATRWAGDNMNLSTNGNISKKVREKDTFTITLFKEYSIGFPAITRLISFVLAVL